MSDLSPFHGKIVAHLVRLSTGVIIGIAVAIAGAILVLVGLFFFIRRRKYHQVSTFGNLTLVNMQSRSNAASNSTHSLTPIPFRGTSPAIGTVKGHASNQSIVTRFGHSSVLSSSASSEPPEYSTVTHMH